jgi:CRISPR/Cas system CSM-associated protein Csm2 small subunit
MSSTEKEKCIKYIKELEEDLKKYRYLKNLENNKIKNVKESTYKLKTENLEKEWMRNKHFSYIQIIKNHEKHLEQDMIWKITLWSLLKSIE